MSIHCRAPVPLEDEGHPDLAAREASLPGEHLITVGRPELLRIKSLGLLSSARTPPDLLLRGLDAVRAVRGFGVTVVSGFHSPLERESLRLMLRGSQPLVICMARRLDGMPIPRAWRDPLDEGRMVLVSSMEERGRRVSAGSARKRNRLAATIADTLFIVHAGVDSGTYRTAAEALDRGRRVVCFEHPANGDLILLGAAPLRTRHDTYRAIAPLLD